MFSGVYIINDGPLVVDHCATLNGTYVGFYFTGDAGGLLFDVDSNTNLSAPIVTPGVVLTGSPQRG